MTMIKGFIVVAIAIVASFLPVYSQPRETMLRLEAPTEAIVRPGVISEIRFRLLDAKGKTITDLPAIQVEVLTGSEVVRASVDSSSNSLIIMGLPAYATKPKPDFISIRLTVGFTGAAITLPYNGDPVKPTVKPTPTPAASLFVDPQKLPESVAQGQVTTISILARDAALQGVAEQEVELEVEPAAKAFVGISPIGLKTDEKGEKKFEIFLKTLPKNASYPANVYLIAKLGNSLAYPFRIELTGEGGGKPLKGDFSVMTDGEAKQVFGRAVANEYYAIVASVENESYDDFQVTHLGFSKPGPGKTSGPSVVPASYGAVRATQERRNSISVRSILLAGIGAVGNMLTGFTPFFHNVGHRDHFTTFTNIITVPGFNAVNSVFPNTVPAELNNLENLGMRGDSIIGRSEFKKYVFVTKKAVKLDKNKESTPDAVKDALGELVVKGIRIARSVPVVLTQTPQ
jgi:hypothetical protein